MSASTRACISSVCLCLCVLACELPTEAENATAPPIVEEVFMFDSVLYEMASAMTPAESKLFFSDLAPDGSSVRMPFLHPRPRFNKLMKGDTIETAEPDMMTGVLVGNCGAVEGAIAFFENDVSWPELRTCYSPSDRLVTVQPTRSGAPMLFLRYGVRYAFALTEAITDKAGNRLARYENSFVVSPFALLLVANEDGSERLYLSPEIAAETEPKIPQLTAGRKSRALRLFFSGPVRADVFSNARLLDRVTGQQVTASDGNGATVFATWGKRDTLNAPTTDPRLIYLLPPETVIEGSGAAGLAAGHYRIQLDQTVVDDGSVTGVPVPLPPIDVDFDVVSL